MAASFVEGRLQKKRLSVQIDSSCAHCAREIRITIASDLKSSMADRSLSPLVFEPEIDWTKFAEPNITRSYCGNSVFFCGEEHAREFRASGKRIDGLYLTLEQSAYSTRIVQGALFAFRTRGQSRSGL